MKYRWDRELKTLFGGAIRAEEGGAPQTMRDIAMTALLNGDIRQLGSIEDFKKRYELIKKLKKADEATEFTTKEAELIKQCLIKVPNIAVLVVGIMDELLDGKEPEEEEEEGSEG